MDAKALAETYRQKGYTVSDKLAAEIYAAAVENKIDPRIAFGLVRTESEFKDYATSHVGAIGLTQLMIPTARWFKKGITESDLRDSQTNLEIGFSYLGELIERYHGDVELALTAYNRGTGTVDRVLKRGGDPDNGYAGKVLNR
jgi:soluble lytic murein transglycosylase-like protein